MGGGGGCARGEGGDGRRGGGDVVESVGVDCLQHGPVQVLSFFRSLDDFKLEHLTWSHCRQLVH